VLFAEIAHTVDGHMPANLSNRFLAEEPLERNMSYFDGEKLTRYPWDEVVSDWLQDLGALQHEADAPLP
jgi:hypothetical protein